MLLLRQGDDGIGMINEIPDNCFQNKYIISMTIPDGITKIRYMAFRECHSLVTVEIPESVNEIGFEAFSFCEKLKIVNLPNKLKKIDHDTFRSCS